MGQLMVRDVTVTSLESPARYSELAGEWTRANALELRVSGPQDMLWKQSHMPNWRVTSTGGESIDYYFAGPGMLYLTVPEGAEHIVFEMPIPVERTAGIAISVVSLLGVVSYALVRRRSRRRGSSCLTP
jgi:hypothetical protein